VIVSLGIAREVGGSDLGRVLATLSDFLRQDARARGEIEARQSWTVNAARVAVAAPWITLLLLCTRPETVAAYSTAAGAVILIGSAVLSVVAYRVMTAIGRLPDEPRVLA
jgi:tight adherence protein B